MRKIITFLAVIGLAIASVHAVSFRLKFTGATSNRQFVRLDSVRIQNLDRSWTETLVYPDTVFISQQTGITDAQGSTAEIAVYPNPANGQTNVAVSVPQSGDATLQLFNLAGQRVAERSVTLEAGENTFEVRMQKAQVYLLAVTTAQGRNTIKILNSGGSAENAIVFHGKRNFVEKLVSSNIIQHGDELKILGYAKRSDTVVISSEVRQQVTANHSFTLTFAIPDLPVLPTVVVPGGYGSQRTGTTITTHGEVLSDGGVPVTARGVCWSTSQNPTISDSHTSDGTGVGVFTSNITGLTPLTTYYLRFYATNSVGTAYSSQFSIPTLSNPPTVTTANISNITVNTATCGGNVTSDGGSTVTARGVCWSTSHNPTVNGPHTTNGTGTGSFTSTLTNLNENTTYYVRAYAENADHISYGNEVSFTTITSSPVVTTSSVTSIGSSTATCGGNVTSAGASSVTARGVCWSTSQLPTVSGSHTTNGSGTGSFTSSITGLSANTTYYVRAYATNANGTSYGSQVNFTTTSVVLPTVTTTSASNITATSASCGGNIVNNTGLAITARGLCWGTSQNPDINGLHSSGGTGSGSFTTTIPNLAPNTTYYVRAYATTPSGTAYGNQINFTTSIAFANAAFSVSANTRVNFAPGNLQWSAKNGGSTATTHTVAGGGTAAGTWRFAPHQWDVIGASNSSVSSTYSGWIDLFGWGTSGYNSKYPYTTANDTLLYAPKRSNIASTNYDWGVYNAIYNPITSTTQSPGTWRTLTYSEWNYLLNTRSTTSGVRYAKATVNGMVGLVILPDNWSTSTYALSSTNTANAAFTTNTITASQWATLESAGAIFLPAAGKRNGTSVLDVANYAFYWTSSVLYGEPNIWFIYSSNVERSGITPTTACSVRLAKNVQ